LAGAAARSCGRHRTTPWRGPYRRRAWAHGSKGDCKNCPASETFDGDECVRGCVLQATECINTVETGNPWRKTEGVKPPWTAHAALTEREARLRAMAESGTAESFLSCDDETKRLFFAQAVDDSSRRKAAEARAEAAERRVRELEGVLRRMEAACDAVASGRSREVYLAMIDSGQSDALLALDSARSAARALLPATQAEGEK
jgi:hypothetical protein